MELSTVCPKCSERISIYNGGQLIAPVTITPGPVESLPDLAALLKQAVDEPIEGVSNDD